MAGLIEEQMGAEGVPPQQVPMQDQMASDPMAADPMDEGMMPEDMMADDGEELDQDNPAFQAALQFAMQALYENGAARDVAESLKAGAEDTAMVLADTAYEMVSIVDERTDGEVPDELIALLAITILQEVADIGEAAGVDVSPENLADAFKEMLLRFLAEQGMDTTQLEQAMTEVDPSVFQQAANTEV